MRELNKPRRRDSKAPLQTGQQQTANTFSQSEHLPLPLKPTSGKYCSRCNSRSARAAWAIKYRGKSGHSPGGSRDRPGPQHGPAAPAPAPSSGNPHRPRPGRARPGQARPAPGTRAGVPGRGEEFRAGPDRGQRRREGTGRLADRAAEAQPRISGRTEAPAPAGPQAAGPGVRGGPARAAEARTVPLTGPVPAAAAADRAGHSKWRRRGRSTDTAGGGIRAPARFPRPRGRSRSWAGERPRRVRRERGGDGERAVRHRRWRDGECRSHYFS